MTKCSTPGWSNRVIGYQCFVDSYATGSSSIDEKSALYTSLVYDKQPRHLNWTDEFSEYSFGYSFYGGDLTGIIHSIQHYLVDFGIDLLYLTQDV